MQAIEFKAVLHNGTLTIPPEYSSQWEGKTIRVILLDEPIPPSQPETHANNEPSIDESIPPATLLSRLKQIKISAPPDFSENLDAYLQEEKSV